MGYTIQHAATNRGSFGDYRYRIYKDGQLVANYWHDYRGDEHGVEFLNGPREESLACRMTEFLVGGGPEPLRLSARAIAWIEENVARGGTTTP